MKKIYLPLVVLLIVSLGACEKVITLPLNEADQKYVIEGSISNIPEYNFVKITKSDDFYETSNFENISGANVTVMDGNGTSFTLTETTPGTYTHPNLLGNSYTNYSLTVDINGEQITAETYMPGNSQIDRIEYLQNDGGFFGDGYTTFLYWNDEASEKNHYRIRAFNNGVKDQAISVTEDNLFNGIPTGLPWFATSFDVADTVVLELMEIDPKTYDYFYSLSQIVDPQNQPAAPGNPNTNLTGDALGVFAAYNVSRDTVVIQ